LADDGERLQRKLAQHLTPDGDFAPGEPLQALGRDAFLEAQCVAAGYSFQRQEQHAHGERPLRWQRDGSLAEQEIARHCGQDTDAVAAFAIGGDRATVGQACQRSEGQPQNVMAGSAVQGRNESDSAGIMIKAGIEKILASGAHRARSPIRI
jgi:hypothetical protein